MILLKSFFLISSNFFLLYLSGLIFLKYFRIKNYSYSIFFIISLISLIISVLYFKLDIQFNIIRIILLIFLGFSLLLSLKIVNKSIIQKIFLDYLIFIPPILLFSTLIQMYGFQYYIFRGNYYDVINYTPTHKYDNCNTLINTPAGYNTSRDSLLYTSEAADDRYVG